MGIEEEIVENSEEQGVTLEPAFDKWTCVHQGADY